MAEVQDPVGTNLSFVGRTQVSQSLRSAQADDGELWLQGRVRLSCQLDHLGIRHTCPLYVGRAGADACHWWNWYVLSARRTRESKVQEELTVLLYSRHAGASRNQRCLPRGHLTKRAPGHKLLSNIRASSRWRPLSNNSTQAVIYVNIEFMSTECTEGSGRCAESRA